jgi:hypothetical protein
MKYVYRTSNKSAAAIAICLRSLVKRFDAIPKHVMRLWQPLATDFRRTKHAELSFSRQLVALYV